METVEKYKHVCFDRLAQKSVNRSWKFKREEKLPPSLECSYCGATVVDGSFTAKVEFEEVQKWVGSGGTS